MSVLASCPVGRPVAWRATAQRGRSVGMTLRNRARASSLLSLSSFFRSSRSTAAGGRWRSPVGCKPRLTAGGWGRRTVMRRAELGPRALEALREELTGRDLPIIGQVADLRLMNARQLQAVHFPTSEHASQAAAVRALRPLSRPADRLAAGVVRLERRVGPACGPVRPVTAAASGRSVSGSSTWRSTSAATARTDDHLRHAHPGDLATGGRPHRGGPGGSESRS